MTKLRTGRKVGVHLYEQTGPNPSDWDPPVGTVFTEELATEIVTALNAIERIRELHRPHNCNTDHIKASTPVPCVNDGACRGCGEPAGYECRTIRALEDQ